MRYELFVALSKILGVRDYKYFFTKLGRRVVVTALVIREYFVQPTLVRNAL